MLKIHASEREGHFRGGPYKHAPQDHGDCGQGEGGVAWGIAAAGRSPDRSTLTGQLSEALAPLARPRTVHDPGRVLADLAVAVADALTISDVAVLDDQREVFGAVASDSTY